MKMQWLAVILGSSLAVAACSSDSSEGPNDEDNNSSSGNAGSSSGDVGSSSGEAGSSSGEVGSSSGETGSSSGNNANVPDCEGFAPSSDEITPTAEVTPPEASGGTIVDGTYQLTSAVIYGAAFASPEAQQGAAMVRLKGTIEIAGNTWRRGFSGAVPAVMQSVQGSGSGTFLTVGANLGGEETCEDGDANNGVGGFTGQFTVSGTELQIVEVAPTLLQGYGASHISYTLQKQ